MKILKFDAKTTKILKIDKNIMRELLQSLEILCENHENDANPNNPCENHENQETH